MRNLLLVVALCAPGFALAQHLTVQPNTPPNGNAATAGAGPGGTVLPPRLTVTPNESKVLWSDAELSAAVPKARTSDVSSPEALLAATYETISGPPGPRDWERFRSLFLPGARLDATYEKNGSKYIAIMSVDTYVQRNGPALEKMAFFENALNTRWERFGRMAIAYSSYESLHAPGGKPFSRGINSFQLLNDGTRWWIAGITWADEGPGRQLPADMERK